MVLFSSYLMSSISVGIVFFFFNDTATTEIYTLSLHDALPISTAAGFHCRGDNRPRTSADRARGSPDHPPPARRSEEHTSELQSPCNIVCRLLLEKKKNNQAIAHTARQSPTLLYHRVLSSDAPS